MALGAQERLIEWMRAQTNALVALDPQEDYIAGNHSRLRSLIGKVDIFLPSAEEVRRLTGGGDWAAASRDFAALGPRLVVVKLGAEGVVVYDAARDLFLRIPAYPAARWTRPARETPFAGASWPLSCPPRRHRGRGPQGAVAASFAISGYGAAGILAATSAEAAQPAGRLDSAQRIDSQNAGGTEASSRIKSTGRMPRRDEFVDWMDRMSATCASSKRGVVTCWELCYRARAYAQTLAKYASSRGPGRDSLLRHGRFNACPPLELPS